MTERTTGLILRTHPLTETSLIVHWLTRDFGRIGTVAKGARRPKSAFRGKLDLFYLAEFTFQRSQRSDLHALREVSLQETHEALRCELACLQQAAYVARLIEQVTETETPVPAIFQLLTEFLAFMSRQPPDSRSVFAFEMKLLQELGLHPDFAKTRLSGGVEQLLRQFTTLDWPALSHLNLTAAQTSEIHHFLHGFLIYHLGKIPRGRAEAVNARMQEPA